MKKISISGLSAAPDPSLLYNTQQSGEDSNTKSGNPAAAANVKSGNLVSISSSADQSDSDDDDKDLESFNWRESVTLDDIPVKELKRQDVINEFFCTEISHVRNLSALHDLFYAPLKNNDLMSREFHQKLFKNLVEVLEVHKKFNKAIKSLLQEGFPVKRFSNLVSTLFFSASANSLIRIFGQFVKDQNTSIIELKKIRGRDSKLDQFLQDQEKNNRCRRLELHSLLPVEHQRLVKYPLLLEQILKYTQMDDLKEYISVAVALQKARRIVKKINEMMASDQNKDVLHDIQNSLDLSGLEKQGGIEKRGYEDCRNLYLPDFWLISEGNVTLQLRQGDSKRSKKIYLLVLKEFLVLLQKQSDKYLLKFQTSQSGQGAEARKCLLSPVLEYSTMYVQTLPNDDKAFNLINLKENTPEVHEFMTTSIMERDKWVRMLLERISHVKNNPEIIKFINQQRRSIKVRASINRRDEHKQSRTDSKVIKVGKINLIQK